jgi:hypothetical protein
MFSFTYDKRHIFKLRRVLVRKKDAITNQIANYHVIPIFLWCFIDDRLFQRARGKPSDQPGQLWPRRPMLPGTNRVLQQI